MEKKNSGEKRRPGKPWICGIDGCDYVFGWMLTDNTVEIFGSKNNLNPKFIVNFLRIIVRCPKCGREWLKRSMLTPRIAKELLDEEDRKLGDAPYGEDRVKKVNRDMHGVASAEELKKVFPDREVVPEMEIKIKNKLLRILKTEQERRAYDIMIAESRNGISGRDLEKAIAVGLGMPLKEGERLHAIIMDKIRGVRKQNLRIAEGEEIDDENWWQQV